MRGTEQASPKASPAERSTGPVTVRCTAPPGSPLDVLGPVVLHGIILLAMLLFATVVVPRFVAIFAEAGTRLPAFTRVVLGLSYSLAHYWMLVTWLGLGVDALICLAAFWAGGRKACWLYGVAVAAMQVVMIGAGVVGLATALPQL